MLLPRPRFLGWKPNPKKTDLENRLELLCLVNGSIDDLHASACAALGRRTAWLVAPPVMPWKHREMVKEMVENEK